MKLAIDMMGGDFAPREIAEGVNLALAADETLRVICFGQEEVIAPLLTPSDRIEIVNCKTYLAMGEEDPFGKIRTDSELSLSQAFLAVRDKRAAGLVTAGPTQGVVIAAHLKLRRLPGLKRLALCPTLPAIGGKERLMLDVGANTEMRPEFMLQHALFAVNYAKHVLKVAEPQLGLINIGTEAGKGRELENAVYALLAADPRINFAGNIEPKEMFASSCDIYLTDGFSGNLVMKTMEGTAKTMGAELKAAIKSRLSAKIGYLFMRGALRDFKAKFNPDNVGGAILFGVDGVVIKAHGASKARAFAQAISLAHKACAAGFIEKVKEDLTR